MSIAALIGHMDREGHFPIHIDQIIKWLKDHNVQDNIQIFNVEMDAQICPGMCERFSVSPGVYAQPELWTNIILAKGLPHDMKRLVACTELLHVYDKQAEQAKNWERIEALANDIVTKSVGIHRDTTLNDMLGPAFALAVLCPPSARRRLKIARSDGILTVSEIAAFLQLPDLYTDIWISSIGDSLEQEVLTKSKNT